MELVSPDPMFRIVLHYAEPQLIVLNVRHRETGEYMDMRSIPDEFFAGFADVSALDELHTVKGLEGYVCIDDNNNWWKEKAAWYLERHRAKDFINQPNAFVQLVLKEEADDVFTLLIDQPEVLAEMQELQHKVITVANRYVNAVTKYWQDNKDLTRKEYAIKGKGELDWVEFTLAMKYYGFEDAPDWNNFFLVQHKKIEWGIE
jgi:T4 RnlA family RNA ligase